MIIIELMVFFTFFWGTRKQENILLSKDCSRKLKGLLTILVFFRHYSEYLSENSVFSSLFLLLTQVIGQLMVGMFFFLSGYGLSQALKKKGKKYIESFNRNHTLKIVLQFWIALLFFCVFNLITNRYFSLKTIILSFLAWDNIGNSNWYVFATVICYFLFWLSIRLYQDKCTYMNILLLVGTLVYCIIIICFKPDYWCSTVLCFPVGVIYSSYNDKIMSIINRNKVVAMMTLIGLTGLFTLLRYKTLIFYIISCILFCLSVVVLLSCIELKKNTIFYWIGDHSFSIYLLQRISMITFTDYVFIKNDLVKCVLCVVFTSVLTLLFDVIWKKVNRLII